MIILDLFEKGGFVMYPLFVIGFLATFFLIVKLWQVMAIESHDSKTLPLERFHDQLETGDIHPIESLNTNYPIDTVISRGIPLLKQKLKHDQIENHLDSIYEAEVHKLDKHMELILTLGEIAPMLGLLGTVSGMITVFKTLTIHGSANPELLSGGISQALITTQVGLIIGIPVMFIYAVLNNQIAAIDKKLRLASSMIVNAAHYKKKG